MTHSEATRVYQDHCPGCGKAIAECYYGGDCLEMQAIYRAERREKLRDINVDEIECDVCGLTYGECSHEDCHDLR